MQPSHQHRLAALVLQRVAVLAFVWLSSQYLWRFFNRSGYLRSMHWPRAAGVDATSPFKTWDAAHYLALAQGGDEPTKASAAFYPLWPALIGTASWLADPLVASLILANVCTVIGVVLLWRTLTHRLDADRADATILLFLAYPAAFYLALPYSEALFFALSAGFFHELEHKRTWNAAAISLAMPLVRAPGHFVVVILGLHQLLIWRREGGSLARTLAPALVPFAGSAAYFGLEWLHTGDPLTGFKNQALFVAQGSISNLWHPIQTWLQFARVHSITTRTYLTAPQDRVAFVATLVALPGLWRLDKTWAHWVFWMGVVPPISSRFMSGMRYDLLAWPIFVVYASFLATPARRPWLWLLVGACVAVQALFISLHALSFWVS